MDKSSNKTQAKHVLNNTHQQKSKETSTTVITLAS